MACREMDISNPIWSLFTGQTLNTINEPATRWVLELRTQTRVLFSAGIKNPGLTVAKFLRFVWSIACGEWLHPAQKEAHASPDLSSWGANNTPNKKRPQTLLNAPQRGKRGGKPLIYSKATEGKRGRPAQGMSYYQSEAKVQAWTKGRRSSQEVQPGALAGNRKGWRPLNQTVLRIGTDPLPGVMRSNCSLEQKQAFIPVWPRLFLWYCPFILLGTILQASQKTPEQQHWAWACQLDSGFMVYLPLIPCLLPGDCLSQISHIYPLNKVLLSTQKVRLLELWNWWLCLTSGFFLRSPEGTFLPWCSPLTFALKRSQDLWECDQTPVSLWAYPSSSLRLSFLCKPLEKVRQKLKNCLP